MKYLSLSVLCSLMLSMVFAVPEPTADVSPVRVERTKLAAAPVAKLSASDAKLCQSASKLFTWSCAEYSKTVNGKKYLYFIKKPDKHVFIVADHGVVSFPLDAGKYRYFENYLVDQSLGAPTFAQREITFDRWAKLKDCNCNLNCSCWQGLDCNCDCCAQHVTSAQTSK